MAQVPLNHFVRASAQLFTTYTQVYSAPVDRAAIILTALAANVTSSPQTVTIGISGNGDGAFVAKRQYIDVVKSFEIPANDTANLAIGKIVLENYDGIYALTSTVSGINLTLSVLETLNTQ